MPNKSLLIKNEKVTKIVNLLKFCLFSRILSC